MWDHLDCGSKILLTSIWMPNKYRTSIQTTPGNDANVGTAVDDLSIIYQWLTNGESDAHLARKFDHPRGVWELGWLSQAYMRGPKSERLEFGLWGARKLLPRMPKPWARQIPKALVVDATIVWL